MKKVLCHGCFDIFHYGHLKHLQAARREGDFLVVSVTSDANVNKGPGRPIFTAAQRMEILLSLAMVNVVIESESAEDAIRQVRPDVYVKGKEYEGRLPEQGLVEELGGRVVFTDEPVYSSTALCAHL